VSVYFQRHLRLADKQLTLTDEISLEGPLSFKALSIGDEFFVRYVPQSRYFQAQELEVHGYKLTEADLARLNQ
jgi:hypothetical protein